MFARAAELDVAVIWTDALNPRPKVWESVKAFLGRYFPDLCDRYRRMLFSERMRAAYVKALRERVVAAARRTGTEMRVAGCA